jgi:hypothetical protein
MAVLYVLNHHTKIIPLAKTDPCKENISCHMSEPNAAAHLKYKQVGEPYISTVLK